MGDLAADFRGTFSKKPKDLRAYILEHYNMMLSYYGKELGLRLARKHLLAYLKKVSHNNQQRSILVTSTCVNTVRDMLKNIFI